MSLPFDADDPGWLVGEWSIKRDLLDRVSDERGSFAGSLHVAAEPYGLGWEEAGTLVWAGRELPATRSLAVRRLDDCWWMTFADGRPFHRWIVGESVEHPCAADVYRGLIEVELTEPLQWRITWQVTGPSKNQLIVSRLRRG